MIKSHKLLCDSSNIWIDLIFFNQNNFGFTGREVDWEKFKEEIKVTIVMNNKIFRMKGVFQISSLNNVKLKSISRRMSRFFIEVRFQVLFCLLAEESESWER